MKKLEERGRQIARERAELMIALIAERMTEQVRGIRVETGPSEVRISGAGMVKRWLSDSSLRFAGDLIK